MNKHTVIKISCIWTNPVHHINILLQQGAWIKSINKWLVKLTS